MHQRLSSFNEIHVFRCRLSTYIRVNVVAMIGGRMRDTADSVSLIRYVTHTRPSIPVTRVFSFFLLTTWPIRPRQGPISHHLAAPGIFLTAYWRGLSFISNNVLSAASQHFPTHPRHLLLLQNIWPPWSRRSAMAILHQMAFRHPTLPRSLASLRSCRL